MGNHADTFCTRLEVLDPAQAIRAIHEALMQLNAAKAGVESLDHAGAIQSLSACLNQAGHIGFGETKPALDIQGIKGINVRFFGCIDPDESDEESEISAQEFESLAGVVCYERNTIFENGVRQICLTRDSENT